MAFNNYLEDENDKPYFTTNSLAYYYDKMEGFAKAVEGSAKALNLTKEEIEQRIALRLVEWDKNLETFDGSVEKLLTEWVDDGTLTHVIDSTLIEQKIAPVALQLADTMNQGFPCSSLGMIPNSPENGDSNLIKLVDAINANKKILVDGEYYLGIGKTNKITKDLDIQGTRTNAKLILNTGVYFRPDIGCNTIKFDGVQFEGVEGNFSDILYPVGAVFIDKIKIKNSNFSKNVRLIKWNFTGSTTIDPTNQKWGIGTFDFSNNKISNTKYNFMVLNDVPFDTIYIVGNEIKNFDYMFHSSGVSNTHLFYEEIRNAMGTLVVKNNNVRCDDSWWNSGTVDLYYCFILTECKETIYEFNHVEGMKSNTGLSVFDAYLSSYIVTYRNNTWKNNVCFSNTLVDAIMQAKGGTNGKRNYDNNTFTLEESFAVKHGMSSDLLEVNLFSATANIDTWVIRNNIFDIYSLNFTRYAVPIKNLWIEGNTFKTYTSRYTVHSTKSVPGTDYRDSVQRLVGNTFLNYGAYSSGRAVQLSDVSDETNGVYKIKKLLVSNNIVEMTNLQTLLNQPTAEHILIENNTVNIPKTDIALSTSVVGTVGKVDKLQIINTSITKENGNLFRSRLPNGGIVEENYSLISEVETNSAQMFSLAKNTVLSKPLIYIVNYEVISNLGVNNLSFKMTYTYDSETQTNKVGFVKKDGTSVNYNLTSVEGNNSIVQVDGNPGALSITFFNNDVYQSGFYLTGLPIGRKTIKVKVTTAT